MTDFISPTKLEHMLVVQHARTKQPALDIGKAVKAGLEGIATREEMVDTGTRLYALSNFLRTKPDLKPWLSETGADYWAGDIALLKAAARAPLKKTKFGNDVIFEAASFKAILREESSSQDET